VEYKQQAMLQLQQKLDLNSAAASTAEAALISGTSKHHSLLLWRMLAALLSRNCQAPGVQLPGLGVHIIVAFPLQQTDCLLSALHNHATAVQ
jgi:hypothetical protein